MAGLAEYQTNATDSFWTWREQMYAFAGRMDPDSLYAVAMQLYVEMLEAGYSSVCEFHYVHHQPDGTPYDDPAAMSHAIIAAARDAGIGLTLLPVLYQRGGFDGRALNERQQRFAHDTDAYLRLIDTLRTEESSSLRVGVCFHSLRAVPEAAMREVLEATRGQLLPVHIHIAEQVRERQQGMRSEVTIAARYPEHKPAPVSGIQTQEIYSLLGAAVAFGLAEIVGGLAPTYLTFAAWTPVIGITALTMITAANTTVQMTTAPELRGRVMALYMMIFMGGTPLGAPIVGWIGEVFGARWTLIGGGAITVVGTLAAVAVFSRTQGLLDPEINDFRSRRRTTDGAGRGTARRECAGPSPRGAHAPGLR